MTRDERTAIRSQTACNRCLVPALRGESIGTHKYSTGAIFNAPVCDDCLEILATVVGFMVLPEKSEGK